MKRKLTGLMQIAERTFMLSMSKEVVEKSNKFDFFIAPLELRNFGILDPEKAEDVFKIGYKATKGRT